MKNTIFVEGKDDISFIQTLISNITVKEISLDGFNGGGDGNNSSITARLKTFLTDFQINPVEKLGIILDLDNFDASERLAFLNKSMQEVFKVSLDGVGVFKKTEIFGMSLEIACYFVNPNLDVLQRKISNNNTEIADCLFSCLEKETIKPKERDKAWVYYYMLWDICDKKERENRSKNVNFKYSAAKKAWKLDSPILSDLRQFLNNFG